MRNITKDDKQNLSVNTRSLFADSSVFLSITLTRLSSIKLLKSFTVMLVPEDGGGSGSQMNLRELTPEIPTIHWYSVSATIVQSFRRMACASFEINVRISEVPFCLSKQRTIT